MKTYYSIAIALFLSAACEPALSSENTTSEEIKAAIISIQMQLVDLTNPLEPLHCKEFISLRKAMSESTGEKIVLLIQNGEFTTTQAEIGVHLLSGLEENSYWKVAAPLLSPKTYEEVLKTVLLQPLPYGPSYANAYKNEKYQKMLLLLRKDSAISASIKDQLDLIVEGRAAKIYKDFLSHPDRFGY